MASLRLACEISAQEGPYHFLPHVVGKDSHMASETRVWREAGNVWWTALASSTPYDMQRCVALGGMDSTLWQHSLGTARASWLLSAARPAAHCSMSGFQKDWGSLSSTLYVTPMN